MLGQILRFSILLAVSFFITVLYIDNSYLFDHANNALNHSLSSFSGYRNINEMDNLKEENERLRKQLAEYEKHINANSSSGTKHVSTPSKRKPIN
jgi:cell shape-determining protein MreC